MIANAEAAAEEMAAAAAAAMGEDPAGGGQEDGEKAKKFSGKALRHALGLSNFWGKKKTAKPPAPPKPILLVAKCEISLGIFDGTCQRRLAVTCPDIETCPPQCIVVGAGQSAVNGTYDMQGFRHDSPWYCNEHGVNLSREIADGHHLWIFGRPPQTFFYLEDTSSERFSNASDKSGPGSPAQDGGGESGPPDNASAPPADGYRSMFEDVKKEGRKAEAVPALPTIMHNFTHRIKHQAQGSGNGAAGNTGWEGGSRLSFEGMRDSTTSRSGGGGSRVGLRRGVTKTY